MLTNFDCSVLYVQDRDKIINAMSVVPEYLKTKDGEAGAVINYMDWSIPLGRKFRALKLWHVINYYGVEGMQKYIKENVEDTQTLRKWIEEDGNYEIVAPTPLNLVCFRHKNGNEFNLKLHEKINQSGKTYLTRTKINGNYILRFSIGQPTTTIDHVRKTWDFIKETANSLG